MAVKLLSTGGGSVTLDVPSTASDFALTVPASSATLLTNKTAGTVLQVVQVVKTDTFSNTTGSWVNVTGLNLSITPSSTSSKILLLSNVFAHGSGNSFLRMTRNGTVIGVGTQEGNREGVGAGDAYNPDDNRNQTFSMMFLDSPSSSSAVSYWVQARSEQNTYSIFINAQTTTASNNIANRPRYASMLIAMEIAG